MRVAIIGCGGIGCLHARAYQTLTDVKIAYMIDINKDLADKAAKDFILNLQNLSKSSDIIEDNDLF